MRSRRPRTWPSCRRAFFEAAVAAALAVTAAGCSGTAAPAASSASTPTPVSFTSPATTTPQQTGQSTQALATATGTSRAPTAPTATTVSTSADKPEPGGNSRSQPTSEGATPDRPFGPRTKDSGCAAHDALPDSACTPGAIFPDVTAEQICQRGYSSSVRNVPAEVSREVYREYGITQRATVEFEVDHLVPLEAGGSNDIANLWPELAEPQPGFHEKDQVENYLHDQVCAGAMSLLEAQRAIATNWLDVYQHLSPRAPATVAPRLAPAPQPAPTSGVQITSVAGASPGGRATVVVQTTAGASCSISYRTPAGTSSRGSGVDRQDGRFERHGLLDLGDRDSNAPGHRDRHSDLQWHEHTQSSIRIG